jgi:hypothetical protein
MAIDFPAAPTLGLEFTAAGIVYVWNGQGWGVKPFAGEAGGPVDSYTKTEAHWYFVDVAGDTMTEGLNIASPTYSFLKLNSVAAGAGADYYGQVAGKNRWIMRMGGTPAEGGSNTGSDFALSAYRDDGASFLGTVMTAKRADLSVDFGGQGKFNNDLRVQRTATAPADGLLFMGNGNSYLYQTGGTFRFTGPLYSDNDKPVWNTGNFNPASYLPIAGGTITGNFAVNGTAYLTTVNASGNLTATSIRSYNDVVADKVLFSSAGLNVTGVSYITGDMTILSGGGGGTGSLGVYGNLTVSGSSFLAGAVTSNSYISDAGGQQGIYYFSLPGYQKYLHFNGSIYLMPNAPFQTANLYVNSSANRWGSDGYLIVTTLGMQPNGGFWGNTSDARIKTVKGEYKTGLDAIKQINPVRYVYKGNDVLTVGADPAVESKNERVAAPAGTPDPRSSNHAVAVAGTEYVGLVAQSVKSIMPELVTLAAGEIDGVPVNDLHILNGTPLVYALINAVKELAAKVEALEAAAAQP